jgi:predicted nicotinamide N-methyase
VTAPRPEDRAQLVLASTVLAASPLVPELKLHLITDACPLWRASEAEAAAQGLVEPYWAFCWPGGQALARYVLDHPELVRGKRVLDFGSGCAIEAIAAMKAGAVAALAADVDPLAAVAARLNAAQNGVVIHTACADLIGTAVRFDVVLAGDVFYDRELAARAFSWLASLDAVVLAGDPARGFIDPRPLELLATYSAGADGDVSGAALKETAVYRVRRA